MSAEPIQHSSALLCQRLLAILDAITEYTGRSLAWLSVVMVLATCGVVILRRFLGLGSIALQESVVYLHSAVFLLGAAYALKHHGQVRVDIFYRRFTPRQRAWVDCLGSLVFLLPLALFTGFISWDFVASAWRTSEGSTDSGGLGGVFLLKSLIPLMALSLTLQALAELLRNLLFLMGAGPEPEQT